MPECPSCRSPHTKRPRFCSHCGYQFATDPRANINPPRKIFTPIVIVGLCVIGATVLVVVSNNSDTSAVATASSKPSAGSSTQPAPKSQSSRRSGSEFAHTGEVVMVNHGPYACASSKAALDEITKWAVRNDRQEMLLTMQRTRSFMLAPDGYQVKILDSTFATRKVRVLGWLDPDDGKIHAYPEDNHIGRECWTPVEAVR